jgi:putative ABC transport system substrate-binding protein
MRRREIITLLGGAVAWPLAARAQHTGKVARIGYVGSASAAAGKSRLICFHDALHQLGWVEGQNINIEYRWGEGDTTRVPGLAAELVGLNLDLIVASGTPAAEAVRHATQHIPVVFNMVSDPVASGIVTNLARPDANITGVSNFFPAVAGKLLELLKTAVPDASRILVLHDPTNTGKRNEVGELQANGKVLGVEIEPIGLRTAEDVDNAFAAMTRAPPQGLITLVDGVTLIHLRRIVDHAARLKLPTMYEERAFVDAGGLMSYALNYCRHFRRSAFYVDKILRGAKPTDLPVELPTTFEYIINLKTAAALGLSLPPTLLALTDEVIE